MNPMRKAVSSSERMNAGMSTLAGMSSKLAGFDARAERRNRAKSFSRVCFLMNSRRGTKARTRASSPPMVPLSVGAIAS